MDKQLEFDFGSKTTRVPPVSVWVDEENKDKSYHSIIEKYLLQFANEETIQSLENELNAELEGTYNVRLETNGNITVSTVQTQFNFEINKE